MLVYLDNCCYNRPFDDQSQPKIQLETQAKLQIQLEIKYGKHELVWSYVLDYENARNPFEEKRKTIAPWKKLAVLDVVETEDIIAFAEGLAAKGIKTFDALHIACAITAGCDYFLTTDRKLLNTPIEGIKIINPVQFVIEQEDAT